jgi:hypothetical protein
MGRKSSDGDLAGQLVIDEELATLYASLQRLKLDQTLERGVRFVFLPSAIRYWQGFPLWGVSRAMAMTIEMSSMHN